MVSVDPPVFLGGRCPNLGDFRVETVALIHPPRLNGELTSRQEGFVGQLNPALVAKRDAFFASVVLSDFGEFLPCPLVGHGGLTEGQPLDFSVVLANGAVPLSILEENVKAWVAKLKG